MSASRAPLRLAPLLTLGALLALAVLFGRQLLRERRHAATSRAPDPSADSERADWDGLQAESSRWMPDELDRVRLGITEEALRRARPGLRPAVTKRRAPAEPYRWLIEATSSGGEIRYAIGIETSRLLRIQVLSRLPHLPALQAHLAAMNERYGSASGLWRCDTGDGVPTLRFTWRGHRVGVTDILLIHPGGISVTLDIAPTTLVQRSLALGGCRPATRADLDRPLPVADPTALRSLAGSPSAP